MTPIDVVFSALRSGVIHDGDTVDDVSARLAALCGSPGAVQAALVECDSMRIIELVRDDTGIQRVTLPRCLYDPVEAQEPLN